MFEFFLGLLVGAFIGWLVPQPEWATNLINKFKS